MVKGRTSGGGEVENGGGGDKSPEATANPGTSSGGTGSTSDGANISTRVGSRTKVRTQLELIRDDVDDCWFYILTESKGRVRSIR